MVDALMILVILAAALSHLAPTAVVPAAQEAQTLADGLRVVRTLYEQRRYQEAATIAERMTREHRGEVDAWMALASVHLAPDWALRRDARAESAAERALKVGGRRNDVVAALAMAKYRQVKYDDALALIAELVDAAPPKVAGAALSDLLTIRAEILLKAHALDPGARERAFADLARAIAATPRSPPPRLLRGEALQQDGRLEEALADLSVAVSDSPGSKQAHKQLQTCLLKLGKRDEARRHYEIWQRLNRLSDSVTTVNAPTPEEARQILRELKELNPADLNHRLDLARAELDLGALDAAIAECDQVLDLNPGWPPAAWLRAEALRVKSGAPRTPAVKPDPDDGGGGGA
jgi:tetratricopeptide (TPR) repeat protein